VNVPRAQTEGKRVYLVHDSQLGTKRAFTGRKRDLVATNRVHIGHAGWWNSSTSTSTSTRTRTSTSTSTSSFLIRQRHTAGAHRHTSYAQRHFTASNAGNHRRTRVVLSVPQPPPDCQTVWPRHLGGCCTDRTGQTRKFARAAIFLDSENVVMFRAVAAVQPLLCAAGKAAGFEGHPATASAHEPGTRPWPRACTRRLLSSFRAVRTAMTVTLEPWIVAMPANLLCTTVTLKRV